MWGREALARAEVDGLSVEDGQRCCGAAEAGQGARDGVGIAQTAEDRMHARERRVEEEVLEIDRDDDVFACVLSGRHRAGTVLDETVGGVVRGQAIKDVTEDAALPFSQARFRGFDEAQGAVALRQPGVRVVLKRGPGFAAKRAAFVGEPIEMRQWDLKPLREIAFGGEGRNVEMPQRRNGVERRGVHDDGQVRDAVGGRLADVPQRVG
jgi:hypothetical protein